MTLQPAPDLDPPAGPGNHACEEGLSLTPRFDGAGLLPAIVTDAVSGAVLMLAWMNAEAFDRTLETGEAWFWSRSRQRLWHKGATSGQIQRVEEIRFDCDRDAVWLKVRMPGRSGCCHTGRPSCFYRRVVGGPSGPALAYDAVRGEAGSQGAWGPSETRRQGPKSALVPVVATGPILTGMEECPNG